ncbi:MAG: patatin-like phospholipase family protein [Pseudomonadota bacterium]
MMKTRVGALLAGVVAAGVLASCSTPVEGPTCRGFDDPLMEASFRTLSAPPSLSDDIAERLGRSIDAARSGVQSFGMQRAARGFQLEVLAITTGGQDGAFAAGFLDGWDSKPDFGAVTGASAGGLIAPVAFAGREFDGKLATFAGVGQDQVVRQKPFGGLFSNSVFATDPLARRVFETYDDALIAAIEAKPDAVLLIGATDLETTRFKRFDIQTMLSAEEPGKKRPCLTAAAMATSAIPAAFPPRAVNGSLYVDAGVRSHVFLEGIDRAVRQVSAQKRTSVGVRVTVLVNNDLTFDAAKAPTSLLPIALRNAAIVGDEGMRASLLQAAGLAMERGWAFRAAAIPSDFELPEGCSREGISSACYTQALFERGQQMGAAGTAWMDRKALVRRVRTGVEE